MGASSRRRRHIDKVLEEDPGPPDLDSALNSMDVRLFTALERSKRIAGQTAVQIEVLENNLLAAADEMELGRKQRDGIDMCRVILKDVGLITSESATEDD